MAQTENIKVRGARNLEHVQCAYMNHQCLAGFGGHAPPGGLLPTKGGGGGGGG